MLYIACCQETAHVLTSLLLDNVHLRGSVKMYIVFAGSMRELLYISSDFHEGSRGALNF